MNDVKINNEIINFRGGHILSYIIDVEDVYSKWRNNKDELVIIDVRFDLVDSTVGEKAYKESHLPQAHYLHIEHDLSGEIKQHGGNHPLPNIDTLTKTFSDIGVSHEKTVVFYDKANDMFAPRAWWLLHYLGHENCYVLNGGFKRWIEKGYPITSHIPDKKRATFQSQINEHLVINIDGVKERVGKNGTYLIDSRARERYLGKVEPLYHKAGHIPGAINYFWADVLNSEGLWKKEDELVKHFNRLHKEDEIIVSCGSGISACPNFLALKMVGFKNVKLYPGSYSDWISYEENEIETTER